MNTCVFFRAGQVTVWFQLVFFPGRPFKTILIHPCHLKARHDKRRKHAERRLFCRGENDPNPTRHGCQKIDILAHLLGNQGLGFRV